MQPTSETYQALLAAGAPKQVRARIHVNPKSNAASAYDTYGQNKIVSATTRASMLDTKLTVGNCIAKELNLVLRGLEGMREIPRMAKIIMEYRLFESAQSGHYSEWIPKGTYYIDTRDTSYAGILTIDAFDPMLKTEQPFMQSDDQGDWPRTDVSVVQTIATAIGVTIDPRTTAIMTNAYDVGYPGIVLEDGTPKYDADGAMSMRQVLGCIGSMYGGNWIITDENKLRLVVLGDIPASGTNLLVTQTGDYITIGGYRILVS